VSALLAQTLFKLIQPFLKLFKPLPSPAQHASLDLKLFPCHQVQVLQAGLEHSLQVTFQFVSEAVQSRWYDLGQATRQGVKCCWIYLHEAIVTGSTRLAKCHFQLFARFWRMPGLQLFHLGA